MGDRMSLQELLTESHFKSPPELDEVPKNIRIIHEKLIQADIDTLIRINLKYEYNHLEEKVDLEAEEIDWSQTDLGVNWSNEEKEHLTTLIEQMYDAGIFKASTIRNIIEGNLPDFVNYNKKEMAFVKKYITKMPNKNKAAIELIEILSESQHRTAHRASQQKGEGKIVHAPKHSAWAERRMLGDSDLMKEDLKENIKIDFDEAFKHEILKNKLREALNPKILGKLKIGLEVTFPSEEVWEQQSKALELNIDEEGGAKDLLEEYRTMRDEIWYVFRLDYVSFEPLNELPYVPRVEKQPERKENWEDQKKPKFKDYVHPSSKHITEEGKKVGGHLEAGGSQTHISTKSASLFYYIKKQMNRLRRHFNA